jgi:acetyl-CoA C-acetyltransferase
MKDIVIASAARTPLAFRRDTEGYSGVGLGAIAVKEALKRAGVKPEEVDEVILWQRAPGRPGPEPGPSGVHEGGCPITTVATTITRSAPRAEVRGHGRPSRQRGRRGHHRRRRHGKHEHRPYYVTKTRWGARMGDTEMIDGMVFDGLFDIFNHYHMGLTAENVAEKYGITRADQDAFAVSSQNKAEAAITSGRFKDEIVPVEIPQKKKDPIIFDTD